MTPIWLTGFEHGVMSTNGGGLFSGTAGGGGTVQGTTKRTGNYALQAACTGSAKLTQKAITATTTLVLRVYLHFSATLPSGDTDFVRLLVDSGNYITFRFRNSDSKIYAGANGALTTVSASTVTTNTWYRFDFRADVHANPWVVDWQIDGVAQTQNTTANAASTMSRIDLGIDASITGTLTFDDIVASATTGDFPIGAGQVDALLPNADGTHNNAADVMEDAAGNDIDGVNYLAWQQLDELPMSDTTTRVQQSTAGTDKYAEVRFAAISPYTVFHGVSGILAYMAAGTLADEGACIIKRSDDTEIAIWGSPAARADYSESSMFYKSAIITPPAGGWTQAEINALRARIGYSNDVSPVPYWENLLIEVASSGVIALAPDNAAQAQAAANVSLIVTLTIDNASQAQAAQVITLTQTHNIEVQSAAQAQAADEITLTQTHNLTVQAARQAQAAQVVTLTQTHYIIVQSASQAQTASRVVLSNPTRDLWNTAALAHGFTATSLTYATDDAIPPGLTLFALSRALYQAGIITAPGEPAADNAQAWAEAITG